MTCEIKGEIRNGLVLSRKDSELLHYHGCIFFFLALSFNVCHIVWQKSRSFLLACNNFIIVFNKLFWFCVNHSVMFNSLQPHGLYSARLLCPWDPLGKNTAPGFYFLLQGIFPTQESNPGLSHCRRTLQCLRQGKPHFGFAKLQNNKFMFNNNKSTEFSFLKKVDDKYATSTNSC